MGVTAVKILLLLLVVSQVKAQGLSGPLTCNNYRVYPGVTISGLTPFIERSFCECQLSCSSTLNCDAFVWNSGQCLHRYGYIMRNTRLYPFATLYVKVCYPLITPPPYITDSPVSGLPYPTRPSICAFPPTQPITPSTTPPSPTRPTVFPPTTPNPCPPGKGLGTGLVVLIACFTAVGGSIIGMLLAIKCCPIGHGKSWFGSSHPSSCSGTTCSPTNKSCHAQGCNGCPPPHHPMQIKPGPCMHSSNMHSGQTYAVPANTSNGIYSVNVSSAY